MNSLLTAEVYILGFLCFLQPNLSMSAVGSIFVFLFLLHDAIFSNSSGFLYYITGALFDLAVIISVYHIKPTKLGLDILNICLASIACNFIGFIMFISYIDPLIYNLSFLVLTFYAIYCFIPKGNKNERGNEYNSYYSFIPGYTNSSNKLHTRL